MRTRGRALLILSTNQLNHDFYSIILLTTVTCNQFQLCIGSDNLSATLMKCSQQCREAEDLPDTQHIVLLCDEAEDLPAYTQHIVLLRDEAD